RMFHELETRIEEESARRLDDAGTSGAAPKQRGATWTYLTSDQPFGTISERLLKGVVKRMKERGF
ncbi:MAG TPA: hypothetical protein VLT16_06570, partial [Candidatus Limnocylindrales bacterium]|nr:hypothetical protein [Candidatus Limnocylindrales bacterium]